MQQEGFASWRDQMRNARHNFCILGPSSIDQASYEYQCVRLDRKHLQILKYITQRAYM